MTTILTSTSKQSAQVIQLADHPGFSGRLNSRSQEGELFIDPREFGACVLFVLVVTSPAIFVTAAVFLYAALIA